MQFDPHGNLVAQIRQLNGGSELEDFVAALLALAGYTVFIDLHIALDGESAGQIDVFASIQTPYHESRVLIECKGGEPTFNDIRKFASLKELLDPSPDVSIIIGKPATKANRDKLADQLGVQIVRRDELTRRILPLFGGIDEQPNRIILLNKCMASFFVLRQLLGRAVVGQMKDHLRELSQNLWHITDAHEQCQESFGLAAQRCPNTAQVTATNKQRQINTYLNRADDDDIEAAMAVETYHRMMNMYAVTRYALDAQSRINQADLAARIGQRLREAFSSITENPRYIFGFPSFFQWWLMNWGGVVRQAVEEDELEQISRECSVPLDATRRYIEVIERVYGGGQNMIYRGGGLMFFKYVPAAFRAIGKRHRIALGLMGQHD
ncbi:MAG: hypothetical protein ACIAXF_15595, partial [Phycisphaerales bacterium JB063]